MTFEHVLALDIAGNPYDWIAPEEAVRLYATDKVAWDLGSTHRVFRGGYSRTGKQSIIRIRPIVAMADSERMVRFSNQPIPLCKRSNKLLFARDRNTCAYCAQVFPVHMLTRDHILPRALGGKDTWTNCCTACKACNQAKGAKRVEDFMPLVYVPFVPSRLESFILSGRNVLADQHEYLAAQLPAHSRLLN